MINLVSTHTSGEGFNLFFKKLTTPVLSVLQGVVVCVQDYVVYSHMVRMQLYLNN